MGGVSTAIRSVAVVAAATAVVVSKVTRPFSPLFSPSTSVPSTSVTHTRTRFIYVVIKISRLTLIGDDHSPAHHAPANGDVDVILPSGMQTMDQHNCLVCGLMHAHDEALPSGVIHHDTQVRVGEDRPVGVKHRDCW